MADIEQNIEEEKIEPTEEKENLSEEVAKPEISEKKEDTDIVLSKINDNLKKEVSKTSQVVSVSGRFSIDFSSPIPSFDTPSAFAFEAKDKTMPNREVYALACNPEVLPRTDILNKLKNITTKGLLLLQDYGVIESPKHYSKTLCLIYEKPLGGRLITDVNNDINRISEIDLTSNHIDNLVSAIEELSKQGIAHRNINPTNLYYKDKERTKLVLGDCAACPTGYNQPSFCETIENLMTQKDGKGKGSCSDDIYSLGATVAYLLLGTNPIDKNMGHFTILDEKIKRGSYNTIIGGSTIPISILEFLRGTLADNINQRWTFTNIRIWLDGKRLSPIQAQTIKKAQRAITFNNKEYDTPRELARAMVVNWNDAYEIIDNGRLSKWALSGLGDEDLSKKIRDIIPTISSRASNLEAKKDIAIAKACMCLDPLAPIRYKNISFYYDGLSYLIYSYIKKDKDTKLFVEVLQREVMSDWFFAQDKTTAPNNILRHKTFMKNSNIGFGLERVLYDLSPNIPCISPYIASHFVTNYKDILKALDDVAKQQNVKKWPIDRHIAAFLMSRIENKILDYISAINSSKPSTASAGMLHLLAYLQWQNGPETLYNLSSWVGGLLNPIIRSYNNKDFIKHLEAEVPKLVRKGSITNLCNYIDNKEARFEDNKGFKEAKDMYNKLSEEYYLLTSDERLLRNDALTVGYQLASFIGILSAVITAFIRMYQNFM